MIASAVGGRAACFESRLEARGEEKEKKVGMEAACWSSLMVQTHDDGPNPENNNTTCTRPDAKALI